jgi:3-oxo-5alpha-steroid 4-dehydrogenase
MPAASAAAEANGAAQSAKAAELRIVSALEFSPGIASLFKAGSLPNRGAGCRLATDLVCSAAFMRSRELPTRRPSGSIEPLQADGDPFTDDCGDFTGGWDDEFDVVVVGFGAAGAAAAIEATRAGARVLVIDRFGGGGATARSGGVVYLGGGSALQKAAGYQDSPEQMCTYLRCELGDAIPEETLRDFCDTSLENLTFLEELGVPFPPRGDAPKTSYPPDDCTLYFSGNELCPPYAQRAEPAPRGHRVLGKGLTGRVLHRALRSAVEQTAAEIRLQTRAIRLIVGPAQDGRTQVRGIEIAALEGAIPRALHRGLERALGYGAMLGGGIARRSRNAIERIERRYARTRRVRTTGGVILCAGGFVFNSQMLREFAPAYLGCMPLGTGGDDGSGIALGRGVGGALGEMDRCTAWRFINPPVALTHGLLVDSDGRRICNEELYGATLGERITEECGGRAWLVIDARTRRAVLAEIRQSKKLNFQNATALFGLFVGRERADGIQPLAERTGMSPEMLRNTVERYNERCDSDLPDELGKSAAGCVAQREPPFYAIRCDSRRGALKAPCLTLGGLVTQAATGRVLREDGSPIPGLHAAGRNAVGVCSHSYVSGLSLADCIYSGRNAGRSATIGHTDPVEP